MRFYARTSPNTGVSFGWLGLVLYAIGWAIVVTVMAVVAVVYLSGLAVWRWIR